MKILSFALVVQMSLGWVCAYPDGKGNAFTDTPLPPGEPQVAWSVDLGNRATACVVFQDNVLFGVEGNAVCYKLSSGKRAWAQAMTAPIVAPPAVSQGVAIFTDSVGSVIFRDVYSGSEMGKFFAEGRIEAPIVIADGIAYVASTSGKLFWFKTTSFSNDAIKSVDLGQPLRTSPLITSSGIVQLTPDGTLFTIHPDTAKVTSSLKTGIIQKIPIQPCANNGIINIADGFQVVRFKDEQRFNVPIASSEVILMLSLPDGKLIVGTKTGIVAVDGDKIMWKKDTGTAVTSLSANPDQVVYGTVLGRFASLKISDGSVLWGTELGGPIHGPVTLLTSGLVVCMGNTLTYFQLWALNPDPSTLDLGHVPTGEAASGNFTMKNPQASSGPITVSCTTEAKEITIEPASITIQPGQTMTFTVHVNSAGLKEGKYESTVTIRTQTSVYKVKVLYNIVPQPFVARLVIGSDVMRMRRGKEVWDVKLDHPPFIFENRTMVPLRAVSESFGPKVFYTKNGCGKQSRVDITLGGTIINHCIGSNDLTLRLPGQEPQTKTFDVASQIKNGRTFVPIRFIAEAFLANVDWEPESKTVIITYQPQ